MCGRTSLANLPEHLQPFLARYGIAQVPPWYTPRYNIAPSQDQMVIVEREGKREAHAMRWGLVPFWAKDPAIGTRMINARCETLATKPAYREAFARRRGLIVVDSYYEWRKNPTGPKTPFRIHRPNDEPFTLAALWERWGTGEDRMETCTVITRAADAGMMRIHDRMPVIVPLRSAEDWLSAGASPDAIRKIIEQDADDVEAYPVSHYVNSPTNDSAGCWEPDGD